MTTRALVLGGGGTVGIAWETGVLHGLLDAGADVSGADLIVGTSAGSVVGAQISLGMSPATLLAAQLAPVDLTQEPQLRFDPQHFAAVAQKLTQAREMTPEALTEIGALALAAPTGEESVYLQRFAGFERLPWPERKLKVTAVDVQSGAFTVWNSAADAPLMLAVASSCAVPGIFPPVTIQGRRYMDGGMRSDTNADLAQGYDRVLVIAPIVGQSEGMTPGRGRPVEREVAQLRAAGAQVELITPDVEALQAFGANLMDVARRNDAAHAGVRQGASFADRVRALWEG